MRRVKKETRIVEVYDDPICSRCGKICARKEGKATIQYDGPDEKGRPSVFDQIDLCRDCWRMIIRSHGLIVERILTTAEDYKWTDDEPWFDYDEGDRVIW